QQLAALALRHGMPAIYTTRDFPDARRLMSYGANTIEASRLGGVYVGRVLMGEKHADLPVQQPAKGELILNLITRQGARRQVRALAARPRRRGDRIDCNLLQRICWFWPQSGPQGMSTVMSANGG